MASLTDQSGTKVFEGTIKNGSPITRAAYNVVRDVAGVFNWSFVYGTELLDVTDPDLPTPVESGVYAITVSFAASGGAAVAGPAYGVSLVMDNNDFGVDAFTKTPGDEGSCSLSMTFYCPAGSPIYVADNSIADPGTPFAFAGRATVQRLS